MHLKFFFCRITHICQYFSSAHHIHQWARLLQLGDSQVLKNDAHTSSSPIIDSFYFFYFGVTHFLKFQKEILSKILQSVDPKEGSDHFEMLDASLPYFNEICVIYTENLFAEKTKSFPLFDLTKFQVAPRPLLLLLQPKIKLPPYAVRYVYECVCAFACVYASGGYALLYMCRSLFNTDN